MVRAALVASLVASAAAASGINHGYKSSKAHLPRTEQPGAVSADLLVAEADLPAHFDWRNVNGQNLVVADWNQHIPTYCGACWIHGTVSALNDRIKIMRRGKFPDVTLGRQSIMNCVPSTDGGPPPGCDGGDAWMIHKYMQENKVPDESCMPYSAKNMGCTPDTICRNCFPGSAGCFAIKNWTGYGVSTFGNISGEAAMMKEIFARGPIACSFAMDEEFVFNYSQVVQRHDGVYVTDKVYTEDQIDHVMEVAGWGETESGEKYWMVRNSWGTYWGSAGWLKFRRGTNQMLSESECDWAVPTFDDLDKVLEGRVLGSYKLGLSPVSAAPAVQARMSAAPASEVKELDGARLPAAGLAYMSEQRAPEPASSVPAVALAFVAGGAVALLAARLAGRARGQTQPPLLG